MNFCGPKNLRFFDGLKRKAFGACKNSMNFYGCKIEDFASTKQGVFECLKKVWIQSTFLPASGPG
jgi:hypothetical protein